MTTGNAPQSAVAPGGTTKSVTTRKEDLVTVVLAAMLIGGSASDAWAHANLGDELESFFTPWHALLYAGFALTAAWTFWLGYRRRSSVARWWLETQKPKLRTPADLDREGRVVNLMLERLVTRDNVLVEHPDGAILVHPNYILDE